MYAAQIPTGELRTQHLPTTYGEWAEYARFAVTFAPKDRESCAEFAAGAFANWRRTSDVPQRLQGPRAGRRGNAVRRRPDQGDAKPHSFALETRSSNSRSHRVVDRRDR